eukprot:7386948-Prymnesium_polylepis.1
MQVQLVAPTAFATVGTEPAEGRTCCKSSTGLTRLVDGKAGPLITGGTPPTRLNAEQLSGGTCGGDGGGEAGSGGGGEEGGGGDGQGGG